MSSNPSAKMNPVVHSSKRTIKLVNSIAVHDNSNRKYDEDWRLQKTEERYLTKVAMLPLAILLIPALLMIFYLILNPDAFMIPIAP